jgi:N-acetylglucosamine-6-phosphate deacetylase
MEIKVAAAVLHEQLLEDVAITVKDGIITNIKNELSSTPTFCNALALPGFIDLHTHGRLGISMFDIGHELLEKYALTGTTSLLAAEGGLNLEQTETWIHKVRNIMQNSHDKEAEVLGIHLEGPFIDPNNAGAIKPGTNLIPTKELIDKFLSYTEIKYITISPFVSGALDAIKRFSQNNIICVSGHSSGDPELFKQAHAAGLRGICHFLNNNGRIEDVFKEGGVRKPTMDEAALLYDDVHLEIICDLKHVDPVFIKIALKVKGPHKIAIITDSLPVAGLPDGMYTYIDGRKINLRNGNVHLVEGGGRCGSCITQVQAFVNLVEHLDIPYAQAARMCSLTPAEILGVEDRKGSLDLGKDADILILDRNTYEILAVYIKGHLVTR